MIQDPIRAAYWSVLKFKYVVIFLRFKNVTTNSLAANHRELKSN